MGRAHRFKANPDRDRQQHERDAKARRTRSLPPGRYAPDPSRSFDGLVQSAAMHEAGHVVAAVALEFGLRFAILYVHEDHKQRAVAGYTEVTLDFLGPFGSKEIALAAATTPDALRVRTMQALAGRIAEASINKNDKDLECGSEGDVKAAIHFAMLALGPQATTRDWTNYVNQHSEAMSQMLMPFFQAVVRVANYLIAHPNEEVPGETLKRLIHGDSLDSDRS